MEGRRPTCLGGAGVGEGRRGRVRAVQAADIMGARRGRVLPAAAEPPGGGVRRGLCAARAEDDCGCRAATDRAVGRVPEVLQSGLKGAAAPALHVECTEKRASRARPCEYVALRTEALGWSGCALHWVSGRAGAQECSGEASTMLQSLTCRHVCCRGRSWWRRGAARLRRGCMPASARRR